ncbi:hypothetical protein NP233_g1558 [Leucocoprinus birnbaumii]|uniref:Uncharacterized protein n=1 Tax=Leucocoprinus birnbaumii TaxID=56174 RepID=A0AAD5W2Y3_9AGAR|nr:hypothetical protein NP233_g1558 [Leucocoprinus birnbaumii]
MFSRSTRSPVLDHEVRRQSGSSLPPPRTHETNSFQSYNYEYCACGYRYKNGNSRYEDSDDAASAWKRLNAEIREHYYSCSKASGSTNPPTSAIRNTLVEPATHKSSGKERRRDSVAPYPHRPSRFEHCRVDEGVTHRQDMRLTSPESSYEFRRTMATAQAESSRHAADPVHHRTITYPPHYSSPPYSSRVRETPERSSVTSTDNSRTQTEPTRRRPLSLAFLVATDPTPVPSSPPLGDESKLPPLYRLKRKYSEIQDPRPKPSSPPHRSTLALHTPRSHDDAPRPPASRASLAPPMRPPIVYEDEGEPPEKKFKKNVMDWRLRRQTLEADELLSEVKAKQVFCKPCGKWIKLDARNDYYPGLWRKHRRTMHEKPASESNVVEEPVAGKSRALTPEEEDELLSSSDEEEQLPVNKRKTGGNRLRRPNYSRDNSRTLPISNTRPVDSSSRITRSCSTGTAN